MNQKTTILQMGSEQSYGTWKSPISSDLIVSSFIHLDLPFYGADNSSARENLYWIEARPQEKGRQVIVQRSTDGTEQRFGQQFDVLPAPFDAHSRVHEYGGGDYNVVGDGRLLFTNAEDQRLYLLTPGSENEEPTITAITEAGKWRYGDFTIDKEHNRVICVREDHSNCNETNHEPVNTIVAINLDGSSLAGEVLASGYDFYSTPRLSPDGTKLAWLSWNHPNMPWDSSELWVAQLGENGNITEKYKVAGGEQESIFQPTWSVDGLLLFISDISGYSNLYEHVALFIRGMGTSGSLSWTGPIMKLANDFGLPQWQLGFSTYAIAQDGSIICCFSRNGLWQLAKIDNRNDQGNWRMTEIETDYTEFNFFTASKDNKVAFVASSALKPDAIVELDVTSGMMTEVRSAGSVVIDKAYLSAPEAIEFPTDDGLSAYGLFYKPTNADFVAPVSERPPLIVMSHGGPTAWASARLNLGIQYYTSRGIAVLDVNYGGSTGFGRAYRERLNGNWGIVDVADCENGAKHLVKSGLVDGDKVAIKGGSAGGYTTLAALTFRDFFKAGASHYGISDLEALAGDTHKFESHYMTGLIGKYPEAKEIHKERSPINFTDKLSCPIIFFQGLDDHVVPPNQAEMMVNAMREKGLPVAYITYEGEGHGFRQAANIKRTIEAEYYFFAKVFGFTPADTLEPVAIENLD